MNVSLINIIACAAVSVAAVLTSLYCQRCRRRRRDWQARCEVFVRGHQQVDRELDRIWQLLDS